MGSNAVTRVGISLLRLRVIYGNSAVVRGVDNGSQLNQDERRRLLVIDDEELFLDLMSVFLGTTFNLVLDQDPRKALERIGKETFDAILTDINMPHVSGLDILDRARQVIPETPVIAITGHAAKGDLRSAVLGRGAALIISKPLLHRQEFINLINQAIEAKRLPG